MEQRTIRNLIYNSFKNYSDNKSLSIVESKSYSYKELYAESLKIALKLKKLGIQKGDKIAILSQNSPNWGIAYLASNILGAVTVPILNDFSKTEIKTILEHSETKVLFISDKFYSKIEEKSEKLEFIFDITSLETVFELSTNKAKIESQNIDLNLNLNETFGEISENDLCTIIYTSGTTGASKGVMLSNKNLVSNLQGAFHIQPLDTNDVFLSVLPLSHTYECTIGFLMPLAFGSQVVYLDAHPSQSVLLPALKNIRPTIILTVPLFIEKIYNNQISPKFSNGILGKLYKISFLKSYLSKIAGKKLLKTLGGRIKFFGIGGALLDAQVEEFLREAKFPYAIGYGLTETSPLLAGCNPNQTKYRAAGFTVRNQELKLINIKESGEGEIVAKGDNIMMGYFKNDELTKSVFTKDGWFKTGDLGYFDEENRLYIRGRLKNVIIGAGGENIYPETIESVVNRHKLVVESIVYEINGKLVAKVHLNYEDIEKKYANLKHSLHNYHEGVNHHINEILEEVKSSVNEEVSRFSRLAMVIEQPVPFEKTPTLKIKKYLYTQPILN